MIKAAAVASREFWTEYPLISDYVFITLILTCSQGDKKSFKSGSMHICLLQKVATDVYGQWP